MLVSGIARNKFHNGGRLRWGPDGKLYAGTGDAQNGGSAQNRNSLNGKVLRINPDGSVPSDNPFGNHVWSYGHRNVQGLAFDSQGRLWEQEFGNSIHGRDQPHPEGRQLRLAVVRGHLRQLRRLHRAEGHLLGRRPGRAAASRSSATTCTSPAQRGTRLYRVHDQRQTA